jgi:mannosyltransferase OCH1-like enzyme
VNPDHRYERITDKNSESYVRDRFSKEIYELFRDIADPILRADLLRYLILYAYGGVWGDIDTRPKQPVSNWIPAEYADKVNFVVGIENDHKGGRIWPTVPYTVQLAQYTVLAKPGHVVMARLMTNSEGLWIAGEGRLGGTHWIATTALYKSLAPDQTFT